jgi:tetratricopeptide (TPR) repeat protein
MLNATSKPDSQTTPTRNVEGSRRLHADRPANVSGGSSSRPAAHHGDTYVRTRATGAHGAPNTKQTLDDVGKLTTRGQYASAQTKLKSFFEGGDFSKPLVSSLAGNHDARYAALNEAGIAHMGMGKPDTAISLFERNRVECHNRGDRAGERAQYQNLAEAYFHKRDFGRMETAATHAYDLAKAANDKSNMRDSLILKGTAQRLAKDAKGARASFAEADRLSKEKGVGPATDIWGLMRAQHLAASSDLAGAKKQVQTVERHKPEPQVQARAFLVRGDIAKAEHNLKDARKNYSSAVALAKKTTAYDVRADATRAMRDLMAHTR